MLHNPRYLSVALLFFLGACGTNVIGSDPCAGANPEPSCGSPCSTLEPCADGFYCELGQCTADCTPGGDQCGDGYLCNQDGQCLSDGTGPDAGPGQGDALDCPSIQVAVQPLTPTVQLLIDQSGSMDADFGGVPRWDAVRTALVDPADGAVTQLQDRVKFGATLYSSIDGNAGGTCPLLVETAPAFNTRAAIESMMQANAPQQDTPTAESVTAVANSFPPEDPNEPGPRIIVLATDGDPDNCVDPDAHDEGSQMMSEMAVQGAYNLGLSTYVLSVGDQVSEPHLQRLANAGQGLDLDTGGATFYVANNAAELVDAFNDIIRGVRSCTLTVDGQVMDPAEGVVILNGSILTYGTDWTMPDPTTIELLGDSCQLFLNEDIVELTAEFPCGTVIL